MQLYHFTCKEYLPSIMETGLNRGSVEVTVEQVINGVWLTTSAKPKGIGTMNGGIMPDNQKADAVRLGMIRLDQINDEIRFPDKTAVRITVDVPGSDPALVRWWRWSKSNTDPILRDNLIKSDGHGFKKWYVYFGTLAPEAFIAVDDLTAAAA